MARRARALLRIPARHRHLDYLCDARENERRGNDQLSLLRCGSGIPRIPKKQRSKQLLTQLGISSGPARDNSNHMERLMKDPTSSTAADNANANPDPEVRLDTNKLVEHKISKLDVDRIRSSVARLTSNSIDGLEGLSTELQALQRFLKSEVERVQGEIESALAGIKIIVDTIAPWKNTVASNAAGARGFRGGPAANIEGAQPRR
jgi:hypothetical protein